MDEEDEERGNRAAWFWTKGIKPSHGCNESRRIPKRRKPQPHEMQSVDTPKTERRLAVHVMGCFRDVSPDDRRCDYHESFNRILIPRFGSGEFIWLHVHPCVEQYSNTEQKAERDCDTGDLGNVIEATSIGGRRSDFFTARKLAPGNLGLLQQYRHKPAQAHVVGMSAVGGS